MTNDGAKRTLVSSGTTKDRLAGVNETLFLARETGWLVSQDGFNETLSGRFNQSDPKGATEKYGH